MDKLIDLCKVDSELTKAPVSYKKDFRYNYNFPNSTQFFSFWLNFGVFYDFGACSIRKKYFANYNYYFLVNDDNILVVKDNGRVLIASNNFKKTKKYVYLYRKLRRVLIDRGIPFEFRDDLNDYFIPFKPILGATIKEMKYNEKIEFKKALEGAL